MNSSNLDLNLPNDFSDLPPPRVSTDVAIEMWLDPEHWLQLGKISKRSATARREHNPDPFVFLD